MTAGGDTSLLKGGRKEEQNKHPEPLFGALGAYRVQISGKILVDPGPFRTTNLEAGFLSPQQYKSSQFLRCALY